MTPLPQNGGKTTVPCLHIPMPDGFEVCWAGPNPLWPGLCFGSTDGLLLFADEVGRVAPGLGPCKGSESGEAINGVIRAGPCVAVSTRGDVNFWPVPGSKGDENGCVVPYGAHGIGVTTGGQVIAPVGLNGIMVVEPPFDPGTSVIALGDSGVYVYRLISLLAPSGGTVLFAAARSQGVLAGKFAGHQAMTVRTAASPDMDVIDICPLELGKKSLAAAALARDGRVVLFRNVLTDDKPVTMKFKRIKGTAYRLLCQNGELYVLTSEGLFVLGKLASRFLDGEVGPGVVTQILTVPMDAIDANLAADRWLLVVMPEEIRRFDTVWIHDNVPDDEAQDFVSASVAADWQWHEKEQTPRQLALTA